MFIKTYVSDKNSKIYTKVTADNYKQILAGKAAWYKMSQEERDAINAMLVANGGKTYEELLAQAEKIKAQIEAEQKVKTGDASDISLWIMLAMLSLAGIGVTTRRRNGAEK